ncbi:MBL fold metallo-hydrolase [Pelotomaculum propionicicum]|uniref:Hydroxyacylglutathione hydrolase GloC n=1 Tax=Pelotomaculum propionicicum TaxID=258475 RepID=A0A4Y7RW49_9FIRM|nr:MBL fold metallo-hydrolase [Pelotomaculum propionicicum]TEB12946.1 Hydroxyacylglutathione hydrolase GloC [Pelotomaculum propionicicum]
MVEEILSDIYKIEVPLPGNPLKALNSYLIKGAGRNLLIDTGFNQAECREALFKGLKMLGADLEQTDIFITHLHADHCGLVTSLANEKSVVYCGEIDAERINWSLSPTYWAENLAFTSSYGFPLQEFSKSMLKHPGQKYSPDREQAFHTVRENDVIEVGDYRFVCLETPGHTPGHICLYEPDRKILISGDHILEDITPNITMFLRGLSDPLGQYLKSLDKVDRMDISLVLPGHRRLISDVHKRVAELKQHYDQRLNEVLNILNKGRMSAYQVASQITWDLTYAAWEQFPLEQRWFATGEAISHLEHLRLKNRVRRFQNQEKLLFELIA